MGAITIVAPGGEDFVSVERFRRRWHLGDRACVSAWGKTCGEQRMNKGTSLSPKLVSSLLTRERIHLRDVKASSGEQRKGI